MKLGWLDSLSFSYSILSFSVKFMFFLDLKIYGYYSSKINL